MLDRLATGRLQLARLVAVVGALVVGVGWVLRDPDDLFLAVALPVAGMALLTAGLAVGSSWLPVHRFEVLLLVGAGLLALARIAWQLATPGPLEPRLLPIVSVGLWALPVLMTAAVASLGRRRGLAYGVGLLLTSLLLVGTTLAVRLPAGAATARTTATLLQVHGVLALFLAVLALLAVSQHGLSDAWQRAAQRQAGLLTDPLTGLANRWALQAALERAHDRVAATGRPLALATLTLPDAGPDTEPDRWQRQAVGAALAATPDTRLTVFAWDATRLVALLEGLPAPTDASLADRLRTDATEALGQGGPGEAPDEVRDDAPGEVTVQVVRWFAGLSPEELLARALRASGPGTGDAAAQVSPPADGSGSG